MLRLLYFALVHATTLSALEGDDAYCPNGSVSDAFVYQMLSLINNKRLILASGLQINGYNDISISDRNLFTKLPPAKFMPEMTYDCALEQNATEALALYSESDDQLQLVNGHFLYSVYFGCEDWMEDFIGDIFAVDSNGFFSEIKSQSVIYMDEHGNSRVYVDLMRADVSRIGCSSKTLIKKDQNEYCLYLCIINQKSIQKGDLIYETGTAKAECDPFIDDSSNESTATLSDSNPSGASYCANGILSTNDVYQVLSLVNTKRAILASGLQVNGTWFFEGDRTTELPQAKNMHKMTYDCILEQNAKKAIMELECDDDSQAFKDPWVSQSNISTALWPELFQVDWYGIASFNTTQSLKYYNWYDDDTRRSYANLMRADASKIGCANRTCQKYNREFVKYLCITDQGPINNGDELYEIRTDKSDIDTDDECGLPWTSIITSTTVFPNTSTSEPQYTTTSSHYTTASSQYTTASPEYTTASTKKTKSTRQCVTKTTKTPCVTLPHAKSKREARAANFREVLFKKSEKHMSQKVRKTDATGLFQNALEEKPRAKR